MSSLHTSQSDSDTSTFTGEPSSPVAHSYAYDETFYRYLQDGAIRSAQLVIPLVTKHLRMESVLDVGCGAGAWLAEYEKHGIPTCVGVDGDYVTESSLLISPASFIARNISQPFDLGRHFDLVQCLEVGEHIEHDASRTLIANLVKHGDCILFSAATPGQGGENHMNEQPYEFWRALFAEHEYEPYDFLRPLLRNSSVERWYRYNSILYVSKRSQAQLPSSVMQSRVPAQERISDVSSLPYRLRSRFLALLPVPWLTRLAILKHQSLILSRRIKGH